METGQAIVAREPSQPGVVNWSLEQVEVASPGDDEVLVEIYAAGICHTDILLSSVPAGAIGIDYPKVVGHEGMSRSLFLPIFQYVNKQTKKLHRCRCCSGCGKERPVSGCRGSSPVVLLLLFHVPAM
jgi:threonine dehydrogenase-like Zn-dependent dehydrogenase